MRTLLVTNKKKSWTQSPIVALFLVIAFVWGCVVVVRIYTKYREAVALRNQSQEELRELQSKQADLTTQINGLSTDRGLESEVRNRYRVVRPGEQLVIVVDPATSATTTQTSGGIASFWQRFLRFVGF